MEEERRVRGRLIEPGVLRVEVDGVPVFWAEGREEEVEAGLLFRVGRADETLPTAGISRLTAAAAAAGSGANAEVDVGPCTTAVRCRGSIAQVSEFLSMFSAVLGDRTLPVLEVRQRLRAEAAPASPASVALGVRYGACGPGLLRHNEYGLEWLGLAEVTTWAERWFSAANAAAWMIAPRLQGTALLLPEGERITVAPLPAPRTDLPALVRSGDHSATVAFVTEPSVALSAALDVIAPLGRVERATVSANAVHAALTVASAESLAGIVAQLEEAVPAEAEGPISSDELIAWCEHELLGTRVIPRPYRRVARQSITGHDLTDAWKRGLTNAVHILPRDASPPGGPLSPAATWSDPPSDGTVHRPTATDVAQPARHVVVERDAIVLVVDEGHAVRARLTGATVLRLASGGRGVWSRDGVYLELYAGDWEAGAQLIEAVDRSVPAESIVPLAT